MRLSLFNAIKKSVYYMMNSLLIWLNHFTLCNWLHLKARYSLTTTVVTVGIISLKLILQSFPFPKSPLYSVFLITLSTHHIDKGTEALNTVLISVTTPLALFRHFKSVLCQSKTHFHFKWGRRAKAISSIQIPFKKSTFSNVPFACWIQKLSVFGSTLFQLPFQSIQYQSNSA